MVIIKFMAMTDSSRTGQLFNKRIAMMLSCHSTTIIPTSDIMAVEHTIIVKEGWGAIIVLVVFVEPVVCLKMPEGNPVVGSLKSWVVLDSLFDSMFVVAFKSKELGAFALCLFERTPNTLHRIVIDLNIFFIGLTHDCFRIPCIIAVKALHICTITQVNYIIRANIIKEFPSP